MAILAKTKYEKLFSYWLISLIFSIAFIIIVGGLTRLTNSGLSITSWDVISGIIPPLNSDDWEHYFSLYKQIPQYKYVNFNITMNEFKIIFFWEYFHRLIGRFIGILFLIPFIYFLFKKVLTKEYSLKFLILFLMILLQGFMGWYMVKSGLIENVSVSHYRLSIHLFIAFIIFSSLSWYYMNFHTQTNKKFFNSSKSFLIIKFFIFLIFLQIILGAFVSGLDAGSVYQTWPLMDENYYPDDLKIAHLLDLFNFNHHGLVQFYHRNLAYFIFVVYLFIGLFLLFKKDVTLYKSYVYLSFFVFIQIILGIGTLVSNLNTLIASLHQISSILLVFFSLRLYHHSIKENRY